MSIQSSGLYLVESASQMPVEAELLDGILEPQLNDWEKHWKPAFEAEVRRMKTAGIPDSHLPQSSHWNWRAKVDYYGATLAYPRFCITCQEIAQGFMVLNSLPPARYSTDAGKPLIYIEYLEVAPWNRAHLTGDVPRFRGVGSALMRVAIEVSLNQGFKGRVGLHSLPQSNNWYANTCGMIDLGPDLSYHNLRYFEMTPDIARAFVTKGNAP